MLQREAQRLGVGELTLEQVEAGLQRRELGLVEVELRQVVVLGRQRVEVALERVVARALHRQPQPHRLDLGAVGVEPAQERLLGHAAVALDRLVDLVGRHRPLLRHQEGDQRELADQLVVVSHGHDRLRTTRRSGRPMIAQAGPRGPSARDRRCRSERGADGDDGHGPRAAHERRSTAGAGRARAAIRSRWAAPDSTSSSGHQHDGRDEGPAELGREGGRRARGRPPCASRITPSSRG